MSIAVTVTLDEESYPDFWMVGAQTEFLGLPYACFQALPKTTFLPSIPHVMARCVKDVMHQIITTRLGGSLG